jgi:mono/diheme cytochrome c family protein
MHQRTTLIGAALAALTLAVPTLGWTAEGPVDQATLERGQAHYLLFCANCHGVAADGRGPLVGLLKVVPSNLTVLRRLGGPSVAERVLTAVDGGHQVAAEGHKMPVFSDNLEVRTVREITLYLDSIQQ